MHFSSRVDISSQNSISHAEKRALARGVPLVKSNDSNPTHHGLGPSCWPEVYDADPRGPKQVRQALSRFLNRRRRLRLESVGFDGIRQNAGSWGDSAVGRGRGTGCQRVDAQTGCVGSAPANPDSLYLLSSTSQAYSWIMKLLCDAGDTILAPAPGYPLVESIARLESVKVEAYRLFYDGSWFIDFAGLQARIERSRVDLIRALVLINPNNPTGSYVKEHERQRLVDLCRTHGIALISDEVFFDYPLEASADRALLAGEDGVLTFALDGFSKMLAAPQAKVGWIQVSGPSADVQEAQRRLDVIADDYLPMSDIISVRIPALLDLAPSQTRRVGARVRANLEDLHLLLQADPNSLVSALRAEGGWSVLLHVPAVIDENRLVLSMIERHALSGQPGYFFDMPSNGYLTLSLLPCREDFRSNVRHILETVTAHLQ